MLEEKLNGTRISLNKGFGLHRSLFLFRMSKYVREVTKFTSGNII